MSAGTCSTASVCTVTTLGETRATAAVMAVWRDASTREFADGCGMVTCCALDELPLQATSSMTIPNAQIRFTL